jgi:hypothetical protein
MNLVERLRYEGFGGNELAHEAADEIARLEFNGTWHPIETAALNGLKVTSNTLLLSHCEKKWVRFGKWYVQEGCWYYSGTNERSQWAQVRGDAPTHWMPMPKAPTTTKDTP